MSLISVMDLQQQLQTMLGPHYNNYLENLRDWFGQRVTKDFFDEEMAVLLSEDALRIHNEMMRQLIFLTTGTPMPQNVVPEEKHKITNTASSSPNDDNGMDISEREVNQIVLYKSEGDDEYPPEYITINVVESGELTPYSMEPSSPEEEVEPIVPVDWLFNAEVVTVRKEDGESTDLSGRVDFDKLPTEITKLQSASDWNRNVVPNISHGYDIGDRLSKFPHLKPHFKSPLKDHHAYLSAGASAHGKFLLKAWEYGIDGGVTPDGTSLALRHVKEHIRKLVTEVVKQRRAFRMRQDKIAHAIGAPYPNPYLRQGHHLFDTPYTTDSMKLADIMQVPQILPTSEELERIAALEAASALPPKQSRFQSCRATLADLLNVIQNDPGIIPYTNLRWKVLGRISTKYKGYAGSYPDHEDEEDYGTLLPLCSY